MGEQKNKSAAMSVIFQEIKDQVAREDGKFDWEDFQDSCIHWDHGRLAKGIDEVARRYATAVTRALREENRQLLLWKESALEVMNKMDLQAIGKEIGLPLGSSIPEHVLPAIYKLKEEIEKGGQECPTK